ncbi:hypothetical protein SALBM217S_06421 [Streptomyces griseoloalbus]
MFGSMMRMLAAPATSSRSFAWSLVSATPGYSVTWESSMP